MRRAVVALALALGPACVPQAEVRRQEDLTLVVVQATASPRVRAYAADELPEALVLTGAADAETYYLWYGRPPRELALLPDARHAVAVAPESASEAEAWTLPPPDRWEAAGRTGEGTLPEALRALRILRPPCPTFAVETSTLTGRIEAAFLLPLGDPARAGVVVGSTVRHDAERELRANHPTNVHYFEPGADPKQLVTYAAPAVLRDMVDPAGWADEAGVHALISSFPGERRTPIQTLYTITATRGVTVRARYPDGAVPRFVNMARHPDADHVWATTASAALGTFDAETGHFTPLLEAPIDRSLGCPVTTRHGVLELAGARRGLASFVTGPLGHFDLDASTAIQPLAREIAEAACRSARAALADGGEIVSFLHHIDLASGAVGLLAWRPAAGDTFRRLELDILPNGAAVAAVGDVALVSLQSVVAGGNAVAVIDFDRRRPDAPPRECPAISVDIDVRHMLWRGDRLAVSGARGHSVAWIRLVDRP